MAEAPLAFLHRFVVPLLGGAELRVGAPVGLRERERFQEDRAALADPLLLELRRRRAELLVADPGLEFPSPEELSLWVGLHNLLALDHPDVGRVWARESTWTAVEQETRAALSIAPPQDPAEALARHVAVGALLELERDDYSLHTHEGELRYFGQLPPRSKLSLMGTGTEGLQVQTVRWAQTAKHPAAGRVLPLALWASPLTSLLFPDLAPRGFSPLSCARWLEYPALARAAVYHWDRHPDWLSLGAAVVRRMPMWQLADPAARSRAFLTGALGEGETVAALPGEVQSPRAGAFERIVCSLIHLHMLKVLDFDVRIGLGRSARDEAMQLFLALPLTLDLLSPTCGEPLTEEEHPRLYFRWKEYLQHLEGLVPRGLLQKTREVVRQSIAQGRAA